MTAKLPHGCGFCNHIFRCAPLAGNLPDDALGSGFTVVLRIDTFGAAIGAETLATLPAKPRIGVLLTDRHGFAVGMVSALHFPAPSVPVTLSPRA